MNRCDTCYLTRHDPLTDPDSPAVTEALTRPCDLCQAPRGQLCRNTIHPNQPLPGRLIHHGRISPR